MSLLVLQERPVWARQLVLGCKDHQLCAIREQFLRTNFCYNNCIGVEWSGGSEVEAAEWRQRGVGGVEAAWNGGSG